MKKRRLYFLQLWCSLIRAGVCESCADEIEYNRLEDPARDYHACSETCQDAIVRGQKELEAEHDEINKEWQNHFVKVAAK
jgi:hypothetical protein